MSAMPPRVHPLMYPVSFRRCEDKRNISNNVHLIIGSNQCRRALSCGRLCFRSPYKTWPRGSTWPRSRGWAQACAHFLAACISLSKQAQGNGHVVRQEITSGAFPEHSHWLERMTDSQGAHSDADLLSFLSSSQPQKRKVTRVPAARTKRRACSSHAAAGLETDAANASTDQGPWHHEGPRRLQHKDQEPKRFSPTITKCVPTPSNPNGLSKVISAQRSHTADGSNNRVQLVPMASCGRSLSGNRTGS